MSELLTGAFWLSLLPPLASALLLLRGRRHAGRHAWLHLPPVLLLGAALAADALADRASGLVALLVLLLGAVVQRFCVRFLQGDRDQSRAHGLLTLAVLGAALTWLATDVRLLLAAWAVALWSLCHLVGLARDWEAARHAARAARRWLGAAWAALAVVLLALAAQHGHWGLPTTPPAALPARATDVLAALLLLAALIPAAQWPLQRWLMSSLTAPTPVSAVMHAGFVNAGGVLLLKFGWLPAATAWALPLLLLLGVASVLAGNGMARVQVDIKRQLAGSTIAQMGLMLAQCALGAPAAALVHLVLHGLFKASLFLQAGGNVGPRPAPPASPGPAHSLLAGLGLAGGVLFLAGTAASLATALSALLLGLALAQGALGLGRLAPRPANGAWLLLPVATALGLHAALGAWLAPDLPQAASPAWPWLLLAGLALLAGATALEWAVRHPRHPLAARAFLHFVAAGEAAPAAQDPHPLHLARRLGQGALP